MENLHDIVHVVRCILEIDRIRIFRIIELAELSMLVEMENLHDIVHVVHCILEIK